MTMSALATDNGALLLFKKIQAIPMKADIENLKNLG